MAPQILVNLFLKGPPTIYYEEENSLNLNLSFLSIESWNLIHSLEALYPT